MSARRLKVAVVGASISNSPDGRERFAIRAHIPALKALPELYEVVAACTTRMESASATAQRFQLPHAFDSVERMLRELPELDVVCVCVRPDTHHRVVMPALRAGKHVYCEHPLGTTTAQAQEMYELALAKGVRTAVGHQMHYEPAVLQMAELVREGYIGKPLAFNITYLTSSYIAPRPSHRQWLFTAEAGGHPAYRTGHNLERLTAVLGLDVAEVCADMAVLVPERPNLDGGAPIRNTQVDNVNFLLRLQDGVMGTMQVCLTAWHGPGWGFQVYGTEGMLMLRREGPGRQEHGQRRSQLGRAAALRRARRHQAARRESDRARASAAPVQRDRAARPPLLRVRHRARPRDVRGGADVACVRRRRSTADRNSRRAFASSSRCTTCGTRPRNRCASGAG